MLQIYLSLKLPRERFQAADKNQLAIIPPQPRRQLVEGVKFWLKLSFNLNELICHYLLNCPGIVCLKASPRQPLSTE